jgi:hypothetical protein
MNLILGFLFSLLILGVAQAGTTTLGYTAGTGTTFRAGTDGSGHLFGNMGLCDGDACALLASVTGVGVQGTNGLSVNGPGASGTFPVTGTVAVTGLGSPFQAGGSIGNASFGLIGNSVLAYVDANHDVYEAMNYWGGAALGAATAVGTEASGNVPTVNAHISSGSIGNASFGLIGNSVLAYVDANHDVYEAMNYWGGAALGAVTAVGTEASGNVPTVNAHITGCGATCVGAAAIAENVVAVGTTSTLIAAARTGLPGTGRVSITIVNTAQATSLCVGNTGVTTSNGMCLPAIAGASITLNTTAAIYGVWGDAGTHNVSFIETF